MSVNEGLSKVQGEVDATSEYGKKLNDAGDTLKKKTVEERRQALADLDSQDQAADSAQRENEDQYRLLSENQTELSAQRDALNQYRQDLEERADIITDARENLVVKENELDGFSGQISSAVSALDRALANPNLPEKQRKEMEAKREELMGYQEAVGLGVEGLSEMFDVTDQTTSDLEEGMSDAESSMLDVDTYLTAVVNPAFDALTASMESLEMAKMKSGTQREQLQAQFAEKLTAIDELDAMVADNVLQNSIANIQMLDSLTSQKQFLDTVDVARPTLWDSTGGLVIGKIGEGFMSLGEFFDNTGDWVEDITRDIPVVKHIGESVNEFPIGFLAGVSEGIGMMADGIGMMVKNPGETFAGLGALIGRDPNSKDWWDWSGKSAKEAWKGLGTAIIALDDWKEGEYGKAIGKIALNVAMTATGVGAAAEAGGMAVAVFTSMRVAGGGVLNLAKASLYAGAKFVQVFPRAFGRKLSNLASSPFKGVGRGLQAIRQQGLKTSAQQALAKAGEKLSKARDTAKGMGDSLKSMKQQGLLETSRQVARRGLAGVRDRVAGYRRTRGLSRSARREISLMKDKVKYAESLAEFNDEVAQIMKKNPKLNRMQAIDELYKTKPELVMKGLKAERAAAGLDKMREAALKARMPEELLGRQAMAVEFSKYSDEISGFLKKDPKTGAKRKLPGHEQRLAELKEMRLTATGKAQAKIDRLIDLEKRLGQQLDDFQAIAGPLKGKYRNENTTTQDWLDDPKFQEYARAQGVDDLAGMGASEFRALQDSFIAGQLDEMLEVAGLSVADDMARMDVTLYGEGTGMNRLRTQGYGSIDEVRDAAYAHVEQFAKSGSEKSVIGIDSARLIQSELDDVFNAARRAGITDPEVMAQLLDDCCDKMVYQTMETATRQLGDHGIRHISGNIRVARQVLAEYEKVHGITITPQMELELMLTHINHDLAYAGMLHLEGFSLTGYHSLLGARYLDESSALIGALKPESIARIKRAILDHDGSEIMRIGGAVSAEEVAFMNAVKLSDNLALFSADKLPEIFLVNPECSKILGQFEQVNRKINEFERLAEVAGKAGKTTEQAQLLATASEWKAKVPPLKRQLQKQVLRMQDAGELSLVQARSLMMAADEVFAKSGEFSLGMFAGKHADEVFTFLEDGTPVISLERTPAFYQMQDALKAGNASEFNAAASQFAKVIDNYAKGNGLFIEGVGDDLILGGKLENNIDALADAIRDGKKIKLVKPGSGEVFMEVHIGDPGRVSTRVASVEEAFYGIESSDPIGKARTAISEVQDEIAGIDRQLSSRSLAGEARRELFDRRMRLNSELRQLQDVEIAIDILSDSYVVERLKVIDSLKKAIASGDKTLFKKYTERMVLDFPEEDVRFLKNSSLTEAEIADRLTDMFYGDLFKKYDVSISSTYSVRRYLSSVNVSAHASGNI